MTGTLHALVGGSYDIFATLRFFIKSGLYRRSRNLFQVAVHKRTKLTLGRGFTVEGKASLHLGDDGGHYPRHTASSLRVGDGAKLILEGNHRILSGHQMDIGPGAEIRFGGGYINHDARISCQHRLTIGRGTIIGEDACIMDSDSHVLVGSAAPRGIEIGEHVWVGARVMILKNSVLHDGVVVAAGAVVSGEFPAGSLIAGVPARVIRENVEWR
jgi:acetyltransferase-like isoleucine patch superfamily enzyme